ncbi:MAG TPA: dUTP diphosphatase [Syntrophorhabdus sp.]|jgi:dUTP pyrophosphatase|nr:dUTP diphosphatase [Syntrophorhabdus sp.]NMC95331.1 dUTP diphosphatase [Syntrophorhabdus sp.]HNS77608.1 dUTP diphosphatase [Syntrophorhabdus sp.]HQB34369.1 dUTP diphosphatase [Syntrophorhabdus sp.]HQG25998.1 dUTP diphosphatase [Syntrophorhabdus sp.]
MERLEVVVKKKDGAILPSYGTEASSGLDLAAFLDKPVVLAPFARALIPTGIYIAIPEGFEAEIRPRSGIAHKYGVTVLNTPGTIDSDYRGEVNVLLINLGDQPFTVNNGDRVAQIIFKTIVTIDWRVTEELPDTKRGHGGFGSTGK